MTFAGDRCSSEGMEEPDVRSPKSEIFDRVEGVRSLETGLRVLSALAEPRPPLLLKAIAKAAALPPSTVHRYLVSLAKLGFVARDSESGAYRLGLATLDLGLAALSQVDVIQRGTSALAALRDEVGETVGLVVWGTAGPTFVRLEEATRNITVNVKAGSVIPVLSSASGQLFAAYLPERTWLPFALREIESDNRIDNPSALKSIEDVRRFVSQVRQAGLSCVSGTVQIGISALSAPVMDSGDQIVATLSVLGSTGSFDATIDGPIALKLRGAATRLSREIGWREGS